MTTLYHPTLPQSVEVDDKTVGDWTDAGWRKTKPDLDTDPSVAATAADKPGEDKKGKN